MKALTRKLSRDLLRLWGQAITIALVVACGISGFVAMESTLRTLRTALDVHYERCRFADVFAHATRAPRSLLGRIEELPGVAAAQGRVRVPLTAPMGKGEPPSGSAIGLPRSGARLNALHLVRGRLPDPARTDEAVVLSAFAEAHGLEPGQPLTVVVEGVERRVRIVGLAMSPELVFSAAAGAIVSDNRRLVVIWMDEDALAPMARMTGAFDDVLVKLQPGASEQTVEEGLDRLLAPYGGQGSYGRSRHPSHVMVTGEMAQIESQAKIIPGVFLGVAAFLLNVVIARLVSLQRGQIAALRALGYTGREVAGHYLGLIGAVVLAGAAMGIGLGAFLGRGLTGMYVTYFHLPSFEHHTSLGTVVSAVALAAVAGGTGGLITARSVARLPPAEAMRPEAPARYGRTLLDRVLPRSLRSGSAVMVLRELGHRPVRAFLSTLGVAMSVSVVVGGRFGNDAIALIENLVFERGMREDVSVSFTQAVPERAARELSSLPGVVRVEAARTVGVRIRAGHLRRDVGLIGHQGGGELRPVVGYPPSTVPMPPEGVVLTDKLAEVLGVRPGDAVEIELLEGDRRVREVRVAWLAPELFGLSAHMDLGALHRLLGEQDAITQAFLVVEPGQTEALVAALEKRPRVGPVERRSSSIAEFRRQTAESMGVTSAVLVAFSVIIAVGVVYNNARIALSMRGRDLATLRVMGFTRGEIAALLIGEIAVQVVAAIPLGLYIGRKLVEVVLAQQGTDYFRFPPEASAMTYGYAALVVLAAAVVSALLVRGKLERLDLIGVLKTRE